MTYLDLHFALLHQLAGELDLKQINMGMSADFGTAIRWRKRACTDRECVVWG